MHKNRVLSLYRECLRRVQRLPPSQFFVDEARCEVRKTFRDEMNNFPDSEVTRLAILEAESALGYLRTVTPKYISRKGKKPYSDLKIIPVELPQALTTEDNTFKEPPKESDYYYVTRDD
jgi:hypothetical protein